MKTFINGQVVAIDPIETKENYSSQRFLVKHQQFDSATGQPRTAEIFPITVFNKKIKELNIEEFGQKHVIVECYVKSLSTVKDDKTFHNLVLNAVSIKCQ